MGGGSYDRDVPYTSSRETYSPASDRVMSSRSRANSSLLPHKRNVTCSNETGIVIPFDVTGSMGNDSKTVRDKLPSLWGQIIYPGKTIEEIKKIEKEAMTDGTFDLNKGYAPCDVTPYLDDFAMSLAAVGDAYSDQAPLQICNFAQGKDLDKEIKKIWLEKGGGPSYRESYELMAYYYARHCIIKDSNLNFFFFIGDEGFYEKINAAQVRKIIGDNIDKDIDSAEIFNELKQKFEVFRLHRKYEDESTDKIIVKQWQDILGAQNVIRLKSAKAVVDVMLGIIALVTEARNSSQYTADLVGKGQTEKRIEEVEEILKPLSNSIERKKKEKPDKTAKGRKPSRRL